MSPAEDPRSPPRLDGVTPVPPGRIATIVSTLEACEPPSSPSPPAPAGIGLSRLGIDPVRYRRLFRAVGEPWLWFSRLVMEEAKLAAILADPRTEAFAVTREGTDIGLLELDFREPERCRIAFFGVIPQETGRGLGRWMMGEALSRAWSRPIARVVVETCTLDHPGALAFYRAAGFRVIRRSVEVAPDPRLTGHAARDSAPHHPIVDDD